MSAQTSQLSVGSRGFVIDLSHEDVIDLKTHIPVLNRYTRQLLAATNLLHLNDATPPEYFEACTAAAECLAGLAAAMQERVDAEARP